MTSAAKNQPFFRTSHVGAIYAILAFSLWGVFPIYFKAVSGVPLIEVLAHRILWTTVLIGVLLVLTGRAKDVGVIFCNRKLLGILVLSSLTVTFNWLLFIWAVSNDRLLEASLGYFINPLVSIALGVVFLKERLRRWQLVAVSIAVIGVGNSIYQHGTVPWISLGVALFFGFYGLLRKVAVVAAFTGLFVETLIMLPPVLAYLAYIEYEGTGTFGRVSWQMDGLLILAGVVTATPLILFAQAARKLRLASLGFFQYITPTGHFLLAVLMYGEPLTNARLMTFGMIWFALAIYTADSVTALRKARLSRLRQQET